MTKEERRLYAKAWYHINKHRVLPSRLAANRDWKARNKELNTKITTNWRLSNPEAVKAYTKRYRSKRKLLLMDSYVRNRLHSDYKLDYKDISQELIEAKRELINLKRVYYEKRLKVC